MFRLTPDHPNLFISRRSHAAHVHSLALQNMKTVAALIPLLLVVRDEILTLEAAVLPNFYPFGQSEGDLFLPPNDDGSSGRVPISILFPFFGQYQNYLFVSKPF